MEEFEFIKKVKDGISLSIVVQPRSSKSEIVGVHDGLLKVRIASPPVDGQANEACVKFFSKLLKVPKSSISIIKGDKVKRKTIKIVCDNIDSLIRTIKLYV